MGRTATSRSRKKHDGGPMRKGIAVVAIIGCLAVIIPAAFKAEAGDEGKQVTYRCEGGRGFDLVYSGDGSRAILILGSKTYRLSRVASDPALQYVGSRASLRFRGKTGFLEINGRPVLNTCRALRKP